MTMVMIFVLDGEKKYILSTGIEILYIEIREVG